MATVNINGKALKFDLWNLIRRDEKYPHLLLYTQVLYRPHFRCKLKVVFVWNTKGTAMFCCFLSDLELSARKNCYLL